MQEPEQGDAGQQAETREVLEGTYEALQTATIEVSGAGAGMQAILVNTPGHYVRPAPTRDQVEIAIKTIPPFADDSDADYVVRNFSEYFGELFTGADEQRVREILAKNALKTRVAATYAAMQAGQVAAAAAPVPEVCGITRLERAQALPELPKGDPADPAPGGIKAFKDTDRRTLHVVVRDGLFFKQEPDFNHPEEV